MQYIRRLVVKVLKEKILYVYTFIKVSLLKGLSMKSPTHRTIDTHSSLVSMFFDVPSIVLQYSVANEVII